MKIKPNIENYLNLDNINLTKIECLNNIAICYYLKKEYNNSINYLDKVK